MKECDRDNSGKILFQDFLEISESLSLFTHSLSYSPTHSLTYSPTHLLIHSLHYTLTHLITHPLTHSLIHPLTHLLTHSLTHPLTHLFIHSLTHSLNSSTYSITHSSFYPVSERVLQRDPREEMLKAFRLFDEDDTGKIALRNLRRVARDLGENVSDDELRAMIDEFDTDHDGESKDMSG